MKYKVSIGFVEPPCLYVETNDPNRAKELCMDKWDLMTSSEKTRFIMKSINEDGVKFGKAEEYD